MMPPIAPGVIVATDMPASEYHADPCPTRSLSSTVARAMVGDLGGCAKMGQEHYSKTTPAMNAGNALHQLILDADHGLEILDFDSYRTDKAKDARDAATAAGKIPMLRHKFEPIDTAADWIIEHLQDAGLEMCHDPSNNTYNELTILYERQMQRGPIWVRTRIDHVKFYPGSGIDAFDLKTRSKRSDAHPDRVSKDIANAGYDVQAATYLDAILAAWPKYAERVRWYWVYAETAKPWLVSVSGRGGVFKARGQRLWNEACEAWAVGAHDGEWPGYHHYEYLPEPGWLEAKENRHE